MDPAEWRSVCVDDMEGYNCMMRHDLWNVMHRDSAVEGGASRHEKGGSWEIYLRVNGWTVIWRGDMLGLIYHNVFNTHNTWCLTSLLLAMALVDRHWRRRQLRGGRARTSPDTSPSNSTSTSPTPPGASSAGSHGAAGEDLSRGSRAASNFGT